MKIGIYAGHFDPPHLGHAWIVEQMESLFDEVHVLVGPNYSKTPEFSEDVRIDMLKDWFHWKPNVKISKLETPNVVEYARSITNDMYQKEKGNFWKNLPSIFIIRGMRNDIDWSYEREIYNCMTKKNPGSIKFMYLMSPGDRKGISSTNVKKACEMQLWNLVLDWCGKALTERLINHYKGDKWLATSPEVASIFETTTAGFTPNMAGFPDDNGNSLQQLADGEATLNVFGSTTPERSLPKWTDLDCSLGQIADPDSGPFDPSFDDFNGIVEGTALGKAREFQEKLETNGFLRWSEIITREQVKSLLDPFPYDVAASEKYHLKEIQVDNDRIGVIGQRHLPNSRSIGPIVIDVNELPPHYQGFGKIIVIEGKHRLLDAKGRKDKTILAWIGDKALSYFN
jgi:pantetheine-phosphate adenylyltransferase